MDKGQKHISAEITDKDIAYANEIADKLGVNRVDYDIPSETRKKSGLECGLGHKYYEEWRDAETSEERKSELERFERIL